MVDSLPPALLTGVILSLSGGLEATPDSDAPAETFHRRLFSPLKIVHLATDYRTNQTTKHTIANTGVTNQICNTSNGHLQPLISENDLQKRPTTHRGATSGTQTWHRCIVFSMVYINGRIPFHSSDGYPLPPRQRRTLTPFGELVLLVVLAAIALAMDQCGTHHTAPIGMAPMTTDPSTSTTAAALRS